MASIRSSLIIATATIVAAIVSAVIARQTAPEPLVRINNAPNQQVTVKIDVAEKEYKKLFEKYIEARGKIVELQEEIFAIQSQSNNKSILKPPSEIPIKDKNNPNTGIIEDSGFEFATQQCSTRKDEKIECKISITNKMESRNLMIANNKSIMLYDNKGNQTNIYSVSLGNLDVIMKKYGGAGMQRNLPRNVPIETTLVFNPTFSDSNLVSEITMEFQSPRFKVSLVDIPLN